MFERADAELFFATMAMILRDRADDEGAARMEHCAEVARSRKELPMAAG